MDTMNELIDKVSQWGEEKGITGHDGKGTIEAQAKKFAEESAELLIAVGKYSRMARDLEPLDLYDVDRLIDADNEVVDSIGDTLVTLILLCDMYGFTLEACLQQAYNVISKRTGKMVDGQFVKDK